MTEKELNVYSKLFDITEQKLSENGKSMQTCRKAFLKTLNISPDEVDLSEMYDVSDDNYRQVLYTVILNRFVGKEEISQRGLGNFESSKEMKEKTLNDALSLTERYQNKTIVSNIPNLNDAEEQRIGLLTGKLRKLKIRIKMLIPRKVKIFLKKIYIKIRG